MGIGCFPGSKPSAVNRDRRLSDQFLGQFLGRFLGRFLGENARVQTVHPISNFPSRGCATHRGLHCHAHLTNNGTQAIGKRVYTRSVWVSMSTLEALRVLCSYGDKERIKPTELNGTDSIRVPSPYYICLLYTSPSPRDKRQSRMPSSA